ncbi:MAG: hypothetical protein ACM3MA_01390 [Acidobacteriota bacterium]
MSSIKEEQGMANPLLVVSILLGVLALALGGAFVWAYTNYIDQKDNVDSKIEAAVTVAVENQKQADEKDYLEREKQPYSKLAAPDELGAVSFSFPKTWSVYVPSDGLKGTDFRAYLHPNYVPEESTTTPFAARVEISGIQYEQYLKRWDSFVKKGDLTSNSITVNNLTGVRLDGKFSTSRSGSMVVFKVRDKTLIIASDSTEFKGDFDDVILKSLDFNP